MTITIQQLVDEDFGYEKGSGIWGRSVKHDSLVVNEQKQKWFWNSAGMRGGILDYLMMIRKLPKQEALSFIKSNSFFSTGIATEEENNYKPYDKLVELFWRSGKDERKYWYDRCLTDSTIDKYRLGFFDGWYFIPIYHEGEFSNFQCRRDLPVKRIRSWYKGTPSVLYNDGILPFIDTIYIVEGTVDAILLSQEGFPSVSTKGANTWQPEWNSKFTHINNIYFVEDNDAAGRVASRTVAKSLGIDRVKIVTFVGKEDKYDTVDFFREYKDRNIFKDFIKENSHFLYELEDITMRKKKQGWRR